MSDEAAPPRPTASQRRMWRLHDFSLGSGLEIGPLHKPVVTRDLADVRYLDVFDRGTLLAGYRDNPMVDTDLIPEIDFTLTVDGRVRSIPETVGDAGPFDWVVASHVIEHVPDLVGWLAQVAEVTADGGVLALVVPDRRYCFDVHRPSTTVGQMLQAHEQSDTAPSVRAVYDAFRGHVSTVAAEVWAGRPPSYDRRIRSLEAVQAQLERVRAGEYVDAHVWTFTPDTLVEQLVELRALGLSTWSVERVRPTRPRELEFYVALRRLPRDPAGWAPWLETEVAPRTDMPDWVAETARLRRRVARLEERLADQRRTTARQRRVVARLRRRLRATQQPPSLRARVGRVLRRG